MNYIPLCKLTKAPVPDHIVNVPKNYDELFAQILVTPKAYAIPNVGSDPWTTTVATEYVEIEDEGILDWIDEFSFSIDSSYFNFGKDVIVDFCFTLACTLKEGTTATFLPTRKELDSAIDEYAMAYQEAETRREYGGVSFLEAMKPVNKALDVVNKMLGDLGIVE